MIEVASAPAPMSAWDPEGSSFYLEVSGETSPVLAPAYGAVQAPHDDDDQSRAAIYEYWWSLGHPGDGGESEHWRRHLRQGRRPAWERLDSPAARVYLYFPTDNGWRAKEVATSVKYLAPAREEATLLEKASSDFKKVQPALADAGEMASKLNAVPAVGGAASAAASILTAVARVKLGSVPQVDGYQWTVAKVATASRTGFAQGVMWTLPAKMFSELGSRITGSVAVSLIPAGRQGQSVSTEPDIRPADLMASAVICHDGRTTSVPKADFVRLRIAPRIVAGH